MRALIQRVSEASVAVDGDVVGDIGHGVVVLVGVTHGDTEEEARWLARKIAGLRIFEDPEGRMNVGLLDAGGEALVVSQFTLLGDCRKGRRPSFINAAGPDDANALYKRFVGLVRQKGISVQTGQFQAMMAVALINDGPVTLILESR